MIIADGITDNAIEFQKKLMGTFEWTEVYAFFPKKCCISKKYTMFGSTIYKGVRKSPFIPHSVDIKYASKEAFMFATIKGDDIDWN